MEQPQFPSTEWSFSINNIAPVEIIHPSGLKFISVVKLNRTDRLEGQDKLEYPLNEKDSFLLSYLIDYFLTKSTHFKLDTSQSMVLSANLFCSYRFRIPISEEEMCNDKELDKGFRKFGEHWVYSKKDPTRKIPAFIIGKGEKKDKTFFAVVLNHSADYIQYELLELPRNYFYRKEV